MNFTIANIPKNPLVIFSYFVFSLVYVCVCVYLYMNQNFSFTVGINFVRIHVSYAFVNYSAGSYPILESNAF